MAEMGVRFSTEVPDINKERNNKMAGKGSRPRKSNVPKEEYSNNFETIFGKKEVKPRWVAPPLPIDDSTDTDTK